MDPNNCPREHPNVQCQCQKGMYLNDEGICVYREECPGNCDKCKEYGLECQQIDKCKESCTGISNPELCDGTDSFVCKCPAGYVFASSDTSDLTCVPEKQCLECGGCQKGQICQQFNCNASCRGIIDPESCTLVTSERPKYRCECPYGLYLNDDNECVRCCDKCPLP